MDPADLKKRFSPTSSNAATLELIREGALKLAELIDGINQTKDSREKSSAISHLEEAVFWANAEVARNSG